MSALVVQDDEEDDNGSNMTSANNRTQGLTSSMAVEL